MNHPFCLNYANWCLDFFDALDKYGDDFGIEVYPVKVTQDLEELLRGYYKEGKTPSQAADKYTQSLSQ